MLRHRFHPIIFCLSVIENRNGKNRQSYEIKKIIYWNTTYKTCPFCIKYKAHPWNICPVSKFYREAWKDKIDT